MKVRSSFVSNSSSSSFLVGVKGAFEKLDNAPPEWKGLASFAKRLIEDVYSGDKITTIAEFEDYAVKQWGWGQGDTYEKLVAIDDEESEWIIERHDKAEKALAEGFVLYALVLDHGDTLCTNIDDLVDGETFIKVYGEY